MIGVSMRAAAACLLLTAASARAEGERAGAFDYYVLALSWSPSWCAIEGDARGAAQCARPLGWSLHGLWPQDERGWPSWCVGGGRDPSRDETGAMADIMGSGGLAWHQWRKHGRCSGLDGAGYLALSRAAYAAVERPALLRRLDGPVRLPVRVVEEAFLEANPGLEPDMITLTCREDRVMEARLCLTKALGFRRCGPDVRRDCALEDALLDPVR